MRRDDSLNRVNAMKRTTTILLMSCGFLAGTAMSAFSQQTLPNLFTGGTGATTAAVNIFQPTKDQPPVDSAEEAATIVLNKTINVYNIQRPAYETRTQRRHRAFGHRYLGFLKQYRGENYPF